MISIKENNSKIGSFIFKKSKTIMFVIGLGFISCGPPRHDLSYLDVKPIELNGNIINKAHDNKNWGRPILTLFLGKDSLYGKDTVSLAIFYCHYELWEKAEIGDSLSKIAGSLEYQLFVDDTVLYFYPYCVEDNDIGIVKNPEWRIQRKNRE